MRFLKVALLIVLVSVFFPLSGMAQAASRSALIVRVKEPNQVTRFVVVSSGAPAQVLYELPAELEYLGVTVSPDLAWLAAYGIEPTSGRPVFAYRRIDGAPIAVPLSAEASVFNYVFDDASRHLLYSVATPDGRFSIGIVRLADGVRRELSGLYDLTSPFGNGVAALPLALFGERLYLEGYTPFSVRIGGKGIFSLDLTPYTFAPTGSYPIIGVGRLLGAGEYLTPRFAPNARLAALLYNEPANPPANYNPFAPSTNMNALAALDLQTGVARRIAAAGAGQGLEHLAWLPNSQTLIFSGGDYGGTDRLAEPDFYAVNAFTGQVSLLGKTFSDAPIVSMAVCGERAYSADGQTLRSAALANWSDVQTHYADASVQIIGCTAH